LVLTLILGILWWRKDHLNNKKQDLENRKNLEVLTNMLVEKNNLLLEKEEEIELQTETEESVLTAEQIEIASYNKRILTDNDWQSFKDYFEKFIPILMRN
jgi:hypothetical protein